MEDSLKWRARHASKYTVLSEMAFDSFSRPTMSSECKRVSLPTNKVVTAEQITSIQSMLQRSDVKNTS